MVMDSILKGGDDQYIRMEKFHAYGPCFLLPNKKKKKETKEDHASHSPIP